MGELEPRRGLKYYSDSLFSLFLLCFCLKCGPEKFPVPSAARPLPPAPRRAAYAIAVKVATLPPLWLRLPVRRLKALTDRPVTRPIAA